MVNGPAPAEHLRIHIPANRLATASLPTPAASNEKPHKGLAGRARISVGRRRPGLSKASQAKLEKIRTPEGADAAEASQFPLGFSNLVNASPFDA